MKFFTFAKLGRALLVAAAIVVEPVFLSECSAGGGELIGDWRDISNGDRLLLAGDGTGMSGALLVKWRAENKRLILIPYGRSNIIAFNYKLSGGELNFFYDTGVKMATYVKAEVFAAKQAKEREEREKREAKEREEREKREALEKEQKAKEIALRIEQSTGYLIDSREGSMYLTVKIGDQVWMTQNLNYKTGKSWCYEDDTLYCQRHGRLYDWATAKTACPAGWHLPEDWEWNTLRNTAGGKDEAGSALKSKSGWEKGEYGRDGNGTDEFGFWATPGGRRDYSDGSFDRIRGDGYWWTATEYVMGVGYGEAYSWSMSSDEKGMRENISNKSYGFSVRCVQDK